MSFWDMMEQFRGRIVWTAAGILLALCLVLFGFWKTLLIAALGAVGYCIGFREDQPDRFSEIVDTLAQKLKKDE